MYAGKEFFGRLQTVVVEEGLGHVECTILEIVARHTYLPDNLFLGGREFGIGQALGAEFLQFAMHQLLAIVGIVVVATEVDAPRTCVGVAGEVALHGIDQAALLAEGDVEKAVHAGASQQVVQQV